MNQLLCHNEFTIVGRIGEDIKHINDNIIRVLVLCPNDEDYEKLANKIYVDFDIKDYNFFKSNVGHAIAITGHIEFDNKIKLISDMFKFIN